MLKRIVLAIALIVTFTGTAIAKTVVYKACTADKKVVALRLELAYNASEAVETDIKNVFIDVSKRLLYVQLISREGYEAFASELSTEDRDVIEGIYGAPQATGETCEVA